MRSEGGASACVFALQSLDDEQANACSARYVNHDVGVHGVAAWNTCQELTP